MCCFGPLTRDSVPFPDEPGPPGNLKATDWDKDHVDLAWEPPKNDGGAPITGYLVEKKDKSGRWQPVFEVSAVARRIS